MSSAPLFHPAKQGDRFSHDVEMATQKATALVSTLVGQALSVVGQAGALAAQVGAAASTAAHGLVSVLELLPRTTTGILERASPTVMLAPGLGAALASAHPADCKLHHEKPIVPGLATVLVQGLPLALVGGQTGCGALLCDGAPTLFVGGPPATGQGHGTEGGSPIPSAIAYAEALAGRIDATVASVQRGVELVEQTLTDTAAQVTGPLTAVSGAISAVTGAFTSLTNGALLGALTGSSLAGPPSN